MPNPVMWRGFFFAYICFIDATKLYWYLPLLGFINPNLYFGNLISGNKIKGGITDGKNP